MAKKRDVKENTEPNSNKKINRIPYKFNANFGKHQVHELSQSSDVHFGYRTFKYNSQKQFKEQSFGKYKDGITIQMSILEPGQLK